LTQKNEALPEGMKALWTIQGVEAESQQNSDSDVNFEFVHSIVYDITYYEGGKLHTNFYWWEEGVHDVVLPYRSSVIVVREGQMTLADYEAAISQRRHYIRQDMVNWGIDEVKMSIYREGQLVEYFSYQIG